MMADRVTPREGDGEKSPRSGDSPLRWHIRRLETPEEMAAVEALSQVVWAGSDLDVVPGHLLLTTAHNGGLVAGAFDGERLVGFVFGFPGVEESADGLRIKHCSHQLAVHPDYRGLGLGFALKHFQWQFVRSQGIERVIWTYDPLLSRNAHLNIARLGAVCNTYLRNLYGEARDSLNAGLPTDRFQVDWWVNAPRVVARMEGQPPRHPRLADLLGAGAVLLNPPDASGAPRPPDPLATAAWHPGEGSEGRTVLVEIPTDFLSLKATDPGLALAWRMAARACLESLFGRGFLVNDFVHEPTPRARSVYVLRQTEF